MSEPGTNLSVVIPTYNRAGLVPGAIESVLSQAGAAQVIVVDDGSSDDTPAVLAEFGGRIQVVRKRNGGISAARNTGIRAAARPRIAFLDDDDAWTPIHHQTLGTALDEAPNAMAAFGAVEEFNEGGPAQSARSGLLCGAMVARREMFDLVGLFREDLRAGEFIDLVARVREQKLELVVRPEIVLRRRIHASNTTLTDPTGRADYAKVLRAALARRRGEST